MSYELLNLGNRVLSINSDFVAIERNDGSVDLFKIIVNSKGIHLDVDHPTSINYATETENPIFESYETESGVRIINF